MRRVTGWTCGWIAVLGLVLQAMDARAGNRYWSNTGEGNWSLGGVGGNWTDQAEPTSADWVYIQNGGTAVCENAEFAGTLLLGETPSTGHGTIRLDDPADSLTVASSTYWGRRATGTVIQTAGTLVCTGGIQMGYFDTGLAMYDMSGGTGIFHNTCTVGNNNGRGHVVQSGGFLQVNTLRVDTDGLYELTNGTLKTISTLQINGGRMLIDGPSAVWNISNGSHTYIANGNSSVLDIHDGMITNAGSVYVGHQNTGTVNQAGGVVRQQANKSVLLGSYSTGAWGTWNLFGGSLELNYANAGALTLGSAANSEGTLNMGNAAGCGTLTQQVAGAGVTVGNSGVGLFRGWSDDGTGNKLYLTGSLTVRMGRIIADGYGTDRALDMTSFSSFVNSQDNPVDGEYGCYAQDHGELRLPSIPVSGDATYYWGEQADQDLVNSAKLDFTGASGSLAGKLYAADHGSVNPLGDMTTISVHEFSVGGMTDCDLTIRYDHTAAATAGLAEDELQLLQWSGSAWSDVTSAVNTNDNLIVASNLTTLSQFVVGAMAPAPRGTIIVIR